MAREWIKMRLSLVTNSKVVAIAKFIDSSPSAVGDLVPDCIADGPFGEYVTSRVTRYVTVTALLCVWGSANEHTDDGVFKNCVLSYIDLLAGIADFGNAMASVGWAEYNEKDNTVSLPNFLDWNTCGKDRTNAERQKKHREKKKESNAIVTPLSSVTVTPLVTPLRNDREEKSREDKSSINKEVAIATKKSDELFPVVETQKPAKDDARQLVLDEWNRMAEKSGRPKKIKITDSLWKKYLSRVSEGFSFEKIAAQLENLNDFSRTGGWLTFDFICDNENNWLKLAEGKYSDTQGSAKADPSARITPKGGGADAVLYPTQAALDAAKGKW